MKNMNENNTLRALSDEELAGQAEVFPLPDGSYLIVEG